MISGQDEMLLEARMLAAQARMLAGAKPAEAVAQAFELSGGPGASVTHIDGLLKRAVGGVRLERQVLLMSLREVAVRTALGAGRRLVSAGLGKWRLFVVRAALGVGRRDRHGWRIISKLAYDCKNYLRPRPRCPGGRRILPPAIPIKCPAANASVSPSPALW